MTTLDQAITTAYEALANSDDVDHIRGAREAQLAEALYDLLSAMNTAGKTAVAYRVTGGVWAAIPPNREKLDALIASGAEIELAFAAPPAASLPNRLPDIDPAADQRGFDYHNGWNDCRNAMIAAWDRQP